MLTPYLHLLLVWLAAMSTAALGIILLCLCCPAVRGLNRCSLSTVPNFKQIFVPLPVGQWKVCKAVLSVTPGEIWTCPLCLICSDGIIASSTSPWARMRTASALLSPLPKPILLFCGKRKGGSRFLAQRDSELPASSAQHLSRLGLGLESGTQ